MLTWHVSTKNEMRPLASNPFEKHFQNGRLRESNEEHCVPGPGRRRARGRSRYPWNHFGGKGIEPAKSWREGALLQRWQDQGNPRGRLPRSRNPTTRHSIASDRRAGGV